jgi:hypothetical protein
MNKREDKRFEEVREPEGAESDFSDKKIQTFPID